MHVSCDKIAFLFMLKCDKNFYALKNSQNDENHLDRSFEYVNDKALNILFSSK